MKPYYSHAGITIYNADCREVLPRLQPFDVALTDPPYGIGESNIRAYSRRHGGFGTHWVDYGHFDWDKAPASPEMIAAVLNSATHCIIWGGNYFTLPLNRKWLVWDKINTGDFADCELAWTNLSGAVRIFRHMWNGMIRASEREASRVHPTQKPIALMKWCLGFVPEAKTVIDPFCGSGSVLVASKLNGQQAIGIEIEEKYCEIAAKRLSQEVLQFEPKIDD